MGKFGLPNKQEMRAPFRSKEAFLEFVNAPQNIEGHVAVGNTKWSNKDLEPTPEEHRTWTW
jgi:NCS1 family nucleobase:cation symporter-1